MKRIPVIVGFILILSLISCSQTPQQASEQNKAITIKFEKTVHDYGNIQEEGDGTCEFNFTNTGEEPLVLRNVRSSCGCTIPEWPREPINPGEQANIKVSYNTKLTGRFSKKISVYSNGSENPVILTVKGNVIAAKTE